MRETQVPSLGREDPLEKGMATHFSILAWEFVDKGAWRATVHEVAKSWTQLSDFPILLFSSISLCWLLRKAFLSLFAILWNSSFKWVYRSFSPLPFASLIFIATCKASSDNHFAFLHFFFLGMVLITASCITSQTSIHSFLGTVPKRSNPLNLFVTAFVSNEHTKKLAVICTSKFGVQKRLMVSGFINSAENCYFHPFLVSDDPARVSSGSAEQKPGRCTDPLT